MSASIISVTGTKGKTTTVSVIADALRAFGMNVLKADTTGHYVNGVRRSTLNQSKEVWGVVPSVAPGRYLYEFHTNPELQERGVAVLECSLGCSSLPGLGYKYHQVGVFLNVFEDHLGTTDRLQTKQDIANAKQFVFERLEPSGSYAVFNADDPFVTDKLSLFDGQATHKNLVPIGLTFAHFDIKAHLRRGGVALTVANGNVVLRTSQGDMVLVDLNKLPWTFGGRFEPSVWNLLSAVGALYGYFKGELPATFRDVMEAIRLDPYGGRLTVLRAENGATIIADYAHEKVSLVKVGELARSTTGENGKVIGVVRLAHDRTDSLIEGTGREIADAYDSFVVYDKIDGYWRKAKDAIRYPQVVGRTSELFAKGIMSRNEHVVRILREDEALAHAARLAGPEDVVVAIVNDDIERSIGFIKDSFKADFV